MDERCIEVLVLLKANYTFSKRKIYFVRLTNYFSSNIILFYLLFHERDQSIFLRKYILNLYNILVKLL